MIAPRRRGGMRVVWRSDLVRSRRPGVDFSYRAGDCSPVDVERVSRSLERAADATGVFRPSGWKRRTEMSSSTTEEKRRAGPREWLGRAAVGLAVAIVAAQTIHAILSLI